jgi:hypothetical protein
MFGVGPQLREDILVVFAIIHSELGASVRRSFFVRWSPWSADVRLEHA